MPVVGVLSVLFFSVVDARSYNRYHSDEGSVKHRLSSTEVGKFRVFWDTSDPYFFVTHSAEPEKILFQTLPSQSFVTVGYATDSNPPIVDGNYKVDQLSVYPLSAFIVPNEQIIFQANEWVLFETGYQSIDKVVVEKNGFSLHGEVWGLVTRATYVMKFSVALEGESLEELPSQLAFEVNVTPIQGTFNRVFLNYWSDSAEKFYGFGSQVTSHLSSTKNLHN